MRPHDVIGWPQGPGEPLALTEALVAQRADLTKPTLFFGLSSSDTLRPELADHFAFRALNGAGTNRRISALADIVPCHVSAIPALLRSGDLRVDVALIQVKPLTTGGFTLGVIADFTQAMIRQARVVIALVNPALPATRGDAWVENEDIDVLVESDDRLIDMPDPEPSAVERLVAEHVAALIPDRATVQLGIGTLPAAVARALSGHRELGVHSGVVSDVLVDLVERGVVTNAHKGRDPGLTVTGGLFGTQRLRDFAERSGTVDMRSADYTHNIAVTSALARFHTINSAIEVDLSGQANAEDGRWSLSRRGRRPGRFRARRGSIVRGAFDHRVSLHDAGREAFTDRRVASRPSRHDRPQRRRRDRDGIRRRASPRLRVARTRAVGWSRSPIRTIASRCFALSARVAAQAPKVAARAVA